MLFHIIVRVRDGATFSLLRGCYALGRGAQAVSTVCEFNSDHLTSLCEVFCLVFDLWFFLMLRRPRCFVTTTVLFLTEQFKKKNKKKRFVPRPCFFPASRKTTPNSVAGCLVRISGSSVVCSDRVTLWLSTVECCWGRDREVSWQSFSPESEPFEARSRGKEGSVFAIKLKQVVCAPPD